MHFRVNEDIVKMPQNTSSLIANLIVSQAFSEVFSTALNVISSGPGLASRWAPPIAASNLAQFASRFLQPRPKKCRPQNSAISSIIGADLGISPVPYRELYRSAYWRARW